MKLKRELKLLDVFCVATGAMISSGLFILPGLAHALAGPAVVVSYVLAGLLAMTGMLSQAELVSAMPKAGGTYFYITRSMGPALGTINGILTWLSIALKSSFALLGMAAFTSLIVNVDIRVIGVALCLFFVATNIIGVKGAGRFQVGFVVVLIGLLLVYVAKGIPAVNLQNFSPFMPNGTVAIISTAGFVFVSYGGLLKIASIAEEVKNPAKTVPLGMVLSLITVGVLYAAVVFVTVGVLGAEKLDNSLTPISDGAFVFMGEAGRIVLGIAAILAFISTANAGIMAASRYPLALSRDRLLPRFFGGISKRFKTPITAICITGIFIASALFLNLTLLVKAASLVLIFTFIFSCLCVIVMRESGVQNYQPRFKSPLYPWIQIVGVLGCWVLVINMGTAVLLVGSGLFLAGLLVFWGYGRARAKQDFALLHLIEKITAKELIDFSLESELKEIIQERDEIVKDRFDKIVEKSIVMDIEGPVQMDEFFRKVSEKISKKLETTPSAILELLIEREKESSTVLGPHLAIPHIIVPGKHTFVILLARCREGIIFLPNKKKIHTVFVIAGTKDERNFHLRALSAIAQIVQDPKFEKKWMKAKNKEALRDIVLLGERKRNG